MPAPMLSPRIHAPRRARRVGSLVAALGFVVVLAGACVGQQDPTGFSASVREDFVAGCVAGFAPGDGGKDPEVAAHRKQCGCIYDEMTDKKTGISFEEFKSAQSAIRKDPTDPANTLDKLIPKFDEFVATCKGRTQAGP